MLHHQYGISQVESPTSFEREGAGGQGRMGKRTERPKRDICVRLTLDITELRIDRNLVYNHIAGKSGKRHGSQAGFFAEPPFKF